MEQQAQLKKLKTAVTLFTIFKFVGLAVLIIGGLLLSIHSGIYMFNFLMYIQGSGSASSINAEAIAYLSQAAKDFIMLLVGLAALITFSILRSKKANKIKEIKQAEALKEAVEAAVKAE